MLSEEEFKKLHQLTTAQAPPLHGTPMTLPGGSAAYLSIPEHGNAPFPGVVVIHEWWGLNANIQHWADRLAGLGFAALAVDLYGGTVATTPDEAMAAMKNVNETDARRILAAAVDFLAADPRIQAPRRGVIGWCFGGGWSLATALLEPNKINATVIYYGHLETDPAKLATIRSPILGFFGAEDQSIPVATVREFESALKKLGKPVEIKIYDGAGHAFANPSGGNYRPEAAKDAWQRTTAFLARHLQRGGGR
jgi:carboxymethylenebutenolidase